MLFDQLEQGDNFMDSIEKHTDQLKLGWIKLFRFVHPKKIKLLLHTHNLGCQNLNDVCCIKGLSLTNLSISVHPIKFEFDLIYTAGKDEQC